VHLAEAYDGAMPEHGDLMDGLLVDVHGAVRAAGRQCHHAVIVRDHTVTRLDVRAQKLWREGRCLLCLI
jgi:hypothetical protein